MGVGELVDRDVGRLDRYARRSPTGPRRCVAAASARQASATARRSRIEQPTSSFTRPPVAVDAESPAAARSSTTTVSAVDQAGDRHGAARALEPVAHGRGLVGSRGCSTMRARARLTTAGVSVIRTRPWYGWRQVDRLVVLSTTGSPGGHDAVWPSGPMPRCTTSKRSGRPAAYRADASSRSSARDRHQVVGAPGRRRAGWRCGRRHRRAPPARRPARRRCGPRHLERRQAAEHRRRARPAGHGQRGGPPPLDGDAKAPGDRLGAHRVGIVDDLHGGRLRHTGNLPRQHAPAFGEPRRSPVPGNG